MISSGSAIFLDSDDFLLPNAVENILYKLHETNPDLLFGRFLLWSPQKGLMKSKDYPVQLPKNRVKRAEYISSALPEHYWNAIRYIAK